MRDGLQDVQKLPFVFVNPLDLNVEQRIRADRDVALCLDPRRQRHFVRSFRRVEIGAERLLRDKRLQLLQPVKVVFPTRPNRPGNQARQRLVRHPQPAPGRHPVGLVHDPARMQLVQFREQAGFHQIGMQGRHAVDLV